MTTEEIRTIKQQIQALEDRFDDFRNSIEDFHVRVDERNALQDTQLKDIKEKTDTIYTAVSWLGTTGRIIKYAAGLLAAIAAIISILSGYLKALIITNLRF